jgi:hypothetical protein
MTMTKGSRAHPALAAVAARAASAGSPAVLFNVTHFGAGNGSAVAPPTDLAPPGDTGQIANETLAFHPAAAGFQLHTWSPATPSKPVGGVSGRRIAVRTRTDDRFPGRQLYDGSAVTNPEFLYDPAHSTEVLVTLGYEPWQPDYADALMIALVYSGMASAAASDVGVPILFLQSPVAPFRDPPGRFREDGSGEAPRVTNSMALRMLVGLDDSDPGKRLALVRKLAEVASEYGLGLQIADRRFGRVRGEWWSVLPADPARYSAQKASRFAWAPPGVPDSVQLLTFVGPARVGSSAAIVADFVARHIGILAVSETSLQEIGFINLMVPVSPARLTGTALSGTCLPVVEGIGQVASDCGLTRRQEVRERTRIGASAAADYQVLSTGPVAPRIARPTDVIDHPLWLSWMIPLEADAASRPPDVAQLVLAQLCSATGWITGGTIDYYRVRALPDGRVKGRAKICVTLPEGTTRGKIPTLLSELCPWAQREVIATLVRDHVPLRAIRLRLAWRERWLGRANTPL